MDQFDTQFFGITPREAARMDPQQRLLLEVCWEAGEDAGLDWSRFRDSKTGVFVGISGVDYGRLSTAGYVRSALTGHGNSAGTQHAIDPYDGTGNSNSIAANRLSYLFDLRAPSVSIDTACSSSLVAIHLASQSLRNEECSMAVAGAVNCILSPEVSLVLATAKMLSPVGQCKTFDASADGYVRGEGCGVVILKRLRDALRDGDRIHAVIRGTAVNQDGRTSGISAPNGLSQQAVIRLALQNAGVAAGDIGYIEAPGTGTPIGDPIEAQAIKKVFPARDSAGPPCYLGSSKANIGHLETAAGMAGLIKTVLVLQRQEIPPQRNLQQLNPHISLSDTPLVIPRESQPFAGNGRPRFAGVSSFGFGGTNAHLILQEPTTQPNDSQNSPAERPQHLLTVSAKSEDALRDLAAAYASQLASEPDASVADFAFTANTGRAHFAYRFFVRGCTAAELIPPLQQESRARPPAMWSSQPSRRELRSCSRARVLSIQTWASGCTKRSPDFRTLSIGVPQSWIPFWNRAFSTSCIPPRNMATRSSTKQSTRSRRYSLSNSR